MQTTVNEDMAVGIPGEMATTRPRYCYAVLASADITLGTPVVITNGKAAPSELADAKGIAVSPHQHVQMKLADDTASLVIPAGQEVGVLERGEVFIVAPAAATAGAAYGTIGIYLKACEEGDIVPVRIG